MRHDDAQNVAELGNEFSQVLPFVQNRKNYGEPIEFGHVLGSVLVEDSDECIGALIDLGIIHAYETRKVQTLRAEPFGDR